MKSYRTRYRKNGNVGIVTVHPSNNGNGKKYDPKLAAHAIREKVQCDDSIMLLCITGEGDRSALLREILEMNERTARLWLRRMKRERERRHEARNGRQHLTHAAALLLLHSKNGVA